MRSFTFIFIQHKTRLMSDILMSSEYKTCVLYVDMYGGGEYFENTILNVVRTL